MMSVKDRIKKGRTTDAPASLRKSIYQLTASFRALPALKVGRFDAEITISSLVRGLRPERDGRCLTANVPKPTSDTGSPFRSAAVMPSMAASSARVAQALDISAASAMESISSDLFTAFLLLSKFREVCQKSRASHSPWPRCREPALYQAPCDRVKEHVGIFSAG